VTDEPDGREREAPASPPPIAVDDPRGRPELVAGSATARRELQAAAIALLASIAIVSLLMLAAGKAPGSVWWAMVTRTAGDPYLLGQVLYRATGLALTGLAVAIALDAGLFNIGAEGQVTAGVLACALVGSSLPAGAPAVIAIPLCLLAAAAAGGAIGGAIGGLRVWRGAHEVITSIMLNAIVVGFALYLGNRLLFRGGTTTGATIAPGAQLPQIGIGGSSANTSIVIAALAVAAVWWLRSQTRWGQAWRAVGQSPEAARTTGISVGKVQTLAMIGSGMLAGLAAANFVMGHKHAFEAGLGGGTGLAGISVALLGRMHPIGVAVAALVLGFVGAGGLAVADLVPKELIEMLPGVVVLAAAVAGPWVRRAEAAS
jgi:general nucleoside transport system permease protein